MAGEIWDMWDIVGMWDMFGIGEQRKNVMEIVDGAMWFFVMQAFLRCGCQESHALLRGRKPTRRGRWVASHSWPQLWLLPPLWHTPTQCLLSLTRGWAVRELDLDSESVTQGWHGYWWEWPPLSGFCTLCTPRTFQRVMTIRASHYKLSCIMLL